MKSAIFITMFVIVSIFFPGCTSITYINPSIQREVDPDIGVIATKNVGERMLIQGMARKYDAIHLKDDLFDGNVLKGVYIANKKIGNYTLYRADKKTGALLKETKQYFASDLYIYKTDKNEVGYCGYSSKIKPIGIIAEKDYDIIEHKSFAEDSYFQQTLTYQGLNNNIINISYREYINDYARPSFSNEAVYDISTNKQIIYKGCIIEIIKVTSGSITYKLIKDF